MPAPVRRETLQRMIEEFDLIPMSDTELDLVLPEIQSVLNAMRGSRQVDLADVRTSHIFQASTSPDPSAD